MRLLTLPILCIAACAAPPTSEADGFRARLEHPEQVFPFFQELVARRDYAGAFDCLHPSSQNAVGGWEGFYLGLTSFDAGRRLVASFEVHALDVEDGRIRVCSREFGVTRTIGLKRLKKVHLLDLTREDIEVLRDRALAWHRFQVRRADGWHFAYPPDWTPASLRRNCNCGDHEP